MRKYLIATHGELARGFQSSLNILADKGNDFQVINAYIIDEDYTPAIDEFIASVQPEERGFIFTDLFGGSVNQKAFTELMNAKKDNIVIITNANLAVILSVLFLGGDEALSLEQIQQAVSESQVQVVPTQIADEDDDSIFD